MQPFYTLGHMINVFVGTHVVYDWKPTSESLFFSFVKSFLSVWVVSFSQRFLKNETNIINERITRQQDRGRGKCVYTMKTSLKTYLYSHEITRW